MPGRRQPAQAPRPCAAHALAAVLLALAALPTLASAQPIPPYRDAARPTDERVRDLIGRMTLEEKFWQLFMIPGSLDDPSHDYANGVFGLQIPPVAGNADGSAPA
ncbi:MAG TPA: hypothetical protein VFZ24_10625, partial [Longimicrobiales bacterium]